MKPLSNQQVDAIAEMLLAHKLSTQLHDDLLDHYCCAVEAEMARGSNFAEALTHANRLICPNGPDEIQSETQYLQSHLKNNPMKKFMYIASFLAPVSLTTSVLFKTYHLQGANMLLIMGTVLFIFALLPLIFYNVYRREPQADLQLKLKVAFGYMGFALFATGLLFKMLHWPTANVQFLLGIIILNLGYFPLLFWKMYRRSAV